MESVHFKILSNFHASFFIFRLEARTESRVRFLVATAKCSPPTSLQHGTTAAWFQHRHCRQFNAQSIYFVYNCMRQPSSIFRRDAGTSVAFGRSSPDGRAAVSRIRSWFPWSKSASKFVSVSSVWHEDLGSFAVPCPYWSRSVPDQFGSWGPSHFSQEVRHTVSLGYHQTALQQRWFMRFESGRSENNATIPFGHYQAVYQQRNNN